MSCNIDLDVYDYVSKSLFFNLELAVRFRSWGKSLFNLTYSASVIFSKSGALNSDDY